MNIGTGIAVAGIWAAVAACAFAIGNLATIIAFFAMIATIWMED